MGILGKGTKTVTETEFSWKSNKIWIENGYLEARCMYDSIRVPLNAIETVVWSVKPTKITQTLNPPLRIIGKGVVLAEITLGVDLISEVQDWIIKNVINKR